MGVIVAVKRRIEIHPSRKLSASIQTTVGHSRKAILIAQRLSSPGSCRPFWASRSAHGQKRIDGQGRCPLQRAGAGDNPEQRERPSARRHRRTAPLSHRLAQLLRHSHTCKVMLELADWSGAEFVCMLEAMGNVALAPPPSDRTGTNPAELTMATRSRKGHWRMISNRIVQQALSNRWLEEQKTGEREFLTCEHYGLDFTTGQPPESDRNRGRVRISGDVGPIAVQTQSREPIRLEILNVPFSCPFRRHVLSLATLVLKGGP